VAHSRPLIRSVDLRELLVLPLPLTRVPDTKALRKDLADVLKRHTPDLREAEDDEQPAEKADTGIEAERTRRRDTLHHSKEGRSDNNVRRPARDGVEHSSNGADL
jgi:hypothetical protein